MFARLPVRFLSVFVISLAASAAGYGQVPAPGGGSNSGRDLPGPAVEVRTANTSSAPEIWTAGYVDPIQGSSSIDLVRRALTSNAQLAATRLEIDRASARLRQAGLRPNPSVDFEQQNGVFNSPGERGTTIGFSMPLELAGQRGRRIDLARAELEASEADVADRERRLASEVRLAFIETLAALRELEVTQNLYSLDIETVRIVEARVEEGEAAPLELSLLHAEVDRLQARRALVEGRLQASAMRLKQLVGMAPDEQLQIREALMAPLLPDPPASLDAAVAVALQQRPDLRFARLSEDVAQAGYRLVKAQSAPQVTAFTKFTDNLSSFDDTPIGVLRDRDRLLAFGVSITLPIFNRNQGAKSEAQLAITQAQRRREFTESVVRAEVTAAYRRFEAAQASIRTYERGVIERSEKNVQTMRAAYQAGAFRVTELLAEQRRLVDMQREMTEALAERYRALAELRAALGVAD
ncbi:MAG TPA: TolC family protein [Blastocatellia bacterium]|nr:TolC family protein [Blastocatellia bacterium]